MQNCILPTLLFLLLTLTSLAARVDTVSVESPSMRKAIKCVVITPDRHYTATNERFPVVYLLHGFGGTYREWIGMTPELTTYADRYNVIIACPDGENSWYFDSQVKPTVRYETYMTAELLPYLDTLGGTYPMLPAASLSRFGQLLGLLEQQLQLLVVG